MLAALYTLLAGFISSIVTTLGLRTLVTTGYILLLAASISAGRLLVDIIASHTISDGYNMLSYVLLLVPANALLCVSTVIATYGLALGYKYTYNIGTLMK
jgi:hypothetical protein